jgi:hypothetical protein
LREAALSDVRESTTSLATEPPSGDYSMQLDIAPEEPGKFMEDAMATYLAILKTDDGELFELSQPNPRRQNASSS